MRWPLLLLLFFGMLYALTVPLFEAPDEPSHFARAYGISEGQFVLRDSPRYLAVFICEKLKKRPHQEKIVSMMAQLLTDFPDRVQQIAPNTAMYSPVPYIFHALVIKVVTSFGKSSGLLTLSIYLCRLTSLFLFISVLYLASRMAPSVFWPVLWICATPMALSQAAVVSVDFVVLGSCVILVAASLGDVKFPAFAWWVTASGLLLMSTKPPYAPMLIIPAVAALFVINATRFQRITAIAGMLVIPFLSAAVWNGLMVSRGYVNEFNALLWKYANLQTDPLGQLDYIKANPLRFLQIVWDTLHTHRITYFHQFVGVLGWQDIPIPFWAAVLWGALAVPAVGVADLSGVKLPVRLFLGITCIAVSVLLVISISASAYMVWMPVAADSINMQGRYFHAVAMVCITGIALITPVGVHKKLENMPLPLFLGGALCIIHIISLVTVWQQC